MSSWCNVTVDDLGEVITGYTPPIKKTEYFGDEYPFITPTDITMDSRIVQTERFLSQKGYEYRKNRLLPRDVVCVTCIGATIGKACMTSVPSATNQQINSVVVNQDKYDPYFVYYLLRSKADVIQGIASGAATPIVKKSTFASINVCVPPLPIQGKIAIVLSAYDDLIENNARRIKILEEMAQAIYRQWFVEFRFPGHEQVEIVEPELGLIPQGWEVVRTEQIIKRVQSGKKYNQKTVEQAGNIPVLDQGQSGIIGYHNDVPGVIASEDEPIIVFANHTCYQRIIQFPFSAIQNVLPFLPHPEKHRNIYWLHWATKDLVELNDYKGHWPEFMSKELPLPPASLCEQFGEFIKPMVQLTYRLEKRNQNLRQTRDLLLPKLISGELDVSELDINID